MICASEESSSTLIAALESAAWSARPAASARRPDSPAAAAITRYIPAPPRIGCHGAASDSLYHRTDRRPGMVTEHTLRAWRCRDGQAVQAGQIAHDSYLSNAPKP